MDDLTLLLRWNTCPRINFYRLFLLTTKKIVLFILKMKPLESNKMQDLNSQFECTGKTKNRICLKIRSFLVMDLLI